MDLNRFCIKIFAADSASAEILEYVPIFHQWIQKQCLEKHLLIDVADYSHVQQGPGIMLIAHEANISTDQTGGQLGILYQRKQPLEGDFEARIKSALRTTLKVCELLETGLNRKTLFRGDQIQISLNDRLVAPSGQKSLSALESFVSGLSAQLYPEETPTIARSADAKGRAAVTIKTDAPVDLKTLLERTE